MDVSRLATFLGENKVKVSDKARPAIDTAELSDVFLRLLRAGTSGRKFVPPLEPQGPIRTRGFLLQGLIVRFVIMPGRDSGDAARRTGDQRNRHECLAKLWRANRHRAGREGE